MKQIYMGLWVAVFILLPLSNLSIASELSLSSKDGLQAPSKPDIQWFKDEMRISPKYIEAQEGILDMSWLHFLLMLFLVIFFFGALIAYYRQTNRTKRILQQLLSEED
jgi:amino acid transporter